MFWMYFAPELILAWAVRQWIAARFIERLFRGAHPSTSASNEKLLIQTIFFGTKKKVEDGRKRTAIFSSWAVSHSLVQTGHIL